MFSNPKLGNFWVSFDFVEYVLAGADLGFSRGGGSRIFSRGGGLGGGGGRVSSSPPNPPLRIGMFRLSRARKKFCHFCLT